MRRSIFKSGVLCLILGAVSGCSTLSFEDHEKKYSELSIKELMASDNMSAEDRGLLIQSLNQRATTDAETGDHESSAGYANMALKLDPENRRAQITLAESLLGLRKYEAAASHFEPLTRENSNPKLDQGYGLTLLGLKKNAQAEIVLNKAVEADPDLWRAWNGLGVIHDMSQSWASAEQAYKKGIAIEGHNVTLNNNLGLSYMRQRRYGEAVIAFENVQTLKGGEDLASMNYRTALALSGHMDRATSGATDIQIAQLYNNLGVASIEAGDNIKAIEYLKKAIATNPTYYANAVKNLEIAKSALP